MAISVLIDKQDSFEIVRDKIAQILVAETVLQKAKAVLANKNSSLWALNVYIERSDAIEQYSSQSFDITPIVNVSYESGEFPQSKGDTGEQQTHEATFNIDCYGAGMSEDTQSGQLCADEQAAKNAQRALRLVRNIIMSSEYRYLGLRGTVGRRWPLSIKSLAPADMEASIRIVVMRLQLRVSFIENSPQYTPVTLLETNVNFKRQENGQIVMAADYIYDVEN